MATDYRLGYLTLVGLVVANMIGSGVFTTSGFALGDLQSPIIVLLAWFAGGLLALCGALSYGSLSRLMPVSGGEYLFLSRAIHPLPGFLAGWVSLLAGFTGAIAYAASTFEVYFLPASLQARVPENSLATLIIVIAAFAHGIRLRHGTILQNISVVLKLALIFIFIGMAFLTTSANDWQGSQAWKSTASTDFSIYTFAMSLMWISFSYAGFNAAIYIASEAREPARILPGVMFTGTLITMFIYLLLNIVFVLIPAPELIAYKQDIAAIAAGVIGGDRLEAFVRVIISIALFTSVSAMIMIGPRVYAKMADDGLMPGFMRFRGEVPATSIWIQAGLAIIVVWISTLQDLLSYLGFTLSLSNVVTVASLFIAVKKYKDSKLALPAYPWAPVIFILFTLLFAGLGAIRQPWQMLAAVITILSGTAMYVVIRNCPQTRETR